MAGSLEGFYEKCGVMLAIPPAAQGDVNSGWYALGDTHRAAFLLFTGVVGANNAVKISVYAATNSEGTDATLVKGMSSSVTADNKLALVEVRAWEVESALRGAKYIQVRADATGTPVYGVLYLKHAPRFEPADYKHFVEVVK